MSYILPYYLLVALNRDGNWRKTGLIIPYWEADRFSDGLEEADEHKTPVLVIHSLEHPSGLLQYSVYF